MNDPTQTNEKRHLRFAADLGDATLSPEATQQLVDALTVNKMELELQNAELRRTQLRLLASRARYFDLYHHAPVGYLTLSEAGMILKANLTAAGLLRVARAALIKQSLTTYILPADQDIYYHHRRDIVATGTRQVCEVRLSRSDSESCWVRLEANAAKSSSRGLVCRTVMSDITARRQAEETLRASEARHRTLFEMSHDALMTLAPPMWQFTAGNSTAVGLFGARDEADLLSRPASEYSPKRQLDGGDSVEKAAEMIDLALSNGSHFYAWTYRRLSGQEFPATVLLTRVELDGHPLLQATVRDETEVKRLQAMLGQADRLTSMGTLAAGVAHEINNPLTYVLNNIETLREDIPKLAAAVEHCFGVLRAEWGDEGFATLVGAGAAGLEGPMLQDMGERASEALDGAQRIKSICKAIGIFSRVEGTERFRIDLNYAIECAATLAMTDIKFRAKLVVDFAPLPAVWASAGKLSQVFLNLLINAAHAIEDGDAQHNRIEVRTWALGEDVFAEIKDTGKGISEEDLRRVFEPFFTTKAIGVGSGLGLPICRNIVSEFGGDIQVESELHKGTRVVVRLPVRRGVSQAPPAQPAAVREVSPARGRILVVDDEQAILTMLLHLLGAEHEIVAEASAIAAQRILLHDQAFDVILCDLMMPEMTGMDLHEWLVRAHPTLARKVVFVTGGAFTPRASEYVTRVGNLRLDKPYERAALRKLMSDLVVSAQGTAERALHS